MRSRSTCSTRKAWRADAPDGLPAYLRRCREQLGLSLGEMVERTRIRVLDHIESERFELLPAALYLKSYLLTYARELGVQESAWLAAAYLERLPHTQSSASAGRSDWTSQA